MVMFLFIFFFIDVLFVIIISFIFKDFILEVIIFWGVVYVEDD